METFDYDGQFELIKKNVAQAFTKALTADAAKAGLSLRARKVWVNDNKDPQDWKGQRDASRKDKTWGVPVYADVELIDRNTGKVLSREPKIRLAILPKNTTLGSFIVNGKHYQVYNQLRRRPGIYVTQKKSRDMKAEVMTTGRSFGIEMDVATGKFSVVRGSSAWPLYPLLSRLGISDSLLAKKWGESTLAANKAISEKKSAQSVISIAKALHPGEYVSADQAVEKLREQFAEAVLDPNVTEETVGVRYKKVSGEVLADAAKQVMLATTGDRRPDDRHALEYKKTLSVSDLIKERFIKENGELTPVMEGFRKGILKKLRSYRYKPEAVKDVIRPSALSPIIDSFFTSSALSNTTDQTNPLNMINGMSKITVLGEGGLASAQRAGNAAHSLHPSQAGFIDPIHTPDSENIGLVMTLPVGVTKSGDQLMTLVYDRRKKSTRRVSPSEMKDLVLSFPDQFPDGKPIGKKVKALVAGEHQLVDPKKVDVVLKSARQAFSVASNTIPFLASAQGVRAQMATKMLEQAIPLKHRQAPLVQVKIGRGTIEDALGSGFSIRSIDAGVVKSVSKTKIVITTRGRDVEYPVYNNLPLNNKAFLNATPTVKPGDEVGAGDVLADSNFTRDGTLALGTNLRAAYIPWKGYNFEDGIVITEDAAEQLTSEHLHEYVFKIEGSSELSKAKYRAHKANGLSPELLAMLDDDGVIKKGTKIHKGDPLWAGVRQNKYDPEIITAKRMLKTHKEVLGFEETWHGDAVGTVIDVVKEGQRVKVYVKTEEPAQIGDKLTNRHGGKGIITRIIPVSDAPHTADGKPVDILLNPAGVVSRINPSQLLETAAAKIADLGKKPYAVDNFNGENHAVTVKKALAVAGISDVETLYDPKSKKPLGEVLVGPQYILKLSKQATSQFSARDDGKYDINRQPLRGGDDGSKSLDMISMYSMLAHGARANLREMATYKAEKNEDFWTWLTGTAEHTGIQAPPPPKPTFAYRKFEAYLKAAGVNVERNGSRLVVGPMTDKETASLSNGEVESPVFIYSGKMSEMKTGLMDRQIFGGREGTRWGHIELAEPIPNPVFETPIKKLIDIGPKKTELKKAQFEGLIRGEVFIDPETGEFAEQGLTGGAAFKYLLSKIDVDTELAHWTDEAKKARGTTKLNRAHTKIKYLRALKKLGVRPEDAYLQTKIPVMPPVFRPIIEMADGDLSVPGLNNLYRDIGLINNELKWQNEVPFITDAIKAQWRGKLYEGTKALAGFTSPIAYYPEKRRPKGIVEQIKGTSPKTGFFQDKLVSRRQDLVGRGTIIPEPKLGLDEVGLPLDMSWKLYSPFVRRRLVVHGGMSPQEAQEAVADRSAAAAAMLTQEMQKRPVILNRAPSLHKFSIMAFKPQVTDGKAIKIPPLVVKGFNADFDGDAMTVHVPILDDAIREAEGMLPSKHLYNPGTGRVMIAPQNESSLGLYLMSKDPKLRKQIAAVLPPKTSKEFGGKVLTQEVLDGMVKSVADELPNEYGDVVDKLKRLGDDHAYNFGVTVSLNDLLPPIPEKDALFKKTFAEVSALRLDTKKGREAAADKLDAVNEEIDAIVEKSLDKQGNNFRLMVRSGARGNMNQLKQIVSAPFMVDDHRGNPSPIPITTSFAAGLPFSDYWSTLYGARASAVDKQLQTANPGAFNKDIMAAAITNVVSKDDCMTTEGLKLPTESVDVEDRFLSKDIRVGGRVLAKAGDAVTSVMLAELQKRKIEQIDVRSPIMCKMPKGTCAKCYGLNEFGTLPAIGDNIGAVAGQSLSEPLTQMTMRTFHQGGISGTRTAISGYAKIDKLFKMYKVKQGKAMLAPAAGRVQRIEKDPDGRGRNVFIDGAVDKKGNPKPVFIPEPEWNSSRIRTGSVVTKGQILSDGIVEPKELVELTKDLPTALSYISGEIQDAYDKQGAPIKRRNIETVLRSIGNTTKILDPGGSSYLRNELAPWTEVRSFNEQSLGKMSVDDVVGHILKEDIPGAKKGRIIDERTKTLIQRAGKSEVEVGPRPIIDLPELHGIERVPMLRKDWMSQLGYRKLVESLVRGATEGEESDIHGYAPVPSFVYGAEFGAEGGLDLQGKAKTTSRSKTEGVY